jgi:hypothetical protein
MRRIILSSVACLAVLYLCRLSYKLHDLGGGGVNVIERKMCVLIFSTTSSETFLILRRYERDIVINIHISTSKASVIFAIF